VMLRTFPLRDVHACAGELRRLLRVLREDASLHAEPPDFLPREHHRELEHELAAAARARPELAQHFLPVTRVNAGDELLDAPVRTDRISSEQALEVLVALEQVALEVPEERARAGCDEGGLQALLALAQRVLGTTALRDVVEYDDGAGDDPAGVADGRRAVLDRNPLTLSRNEGRVLRETGRNTRCHHFVQRIERRLTRLFVEDAENVVEL